MIHFEDLWEKCENFHKEESSSSNEEVINQLSLQIDLYNKISQKSEISKEEIEKAKLRVFGEILLSLTNLSLIDNIDVFNALHISLMQNSIKHYSNKYES